MNPRLKIVLIILFAAAAGIFISFYFAKKKTAHEDYYLATPPAVTSKPSKIPSKTPVPQPAGVPRMAIILDDWGNNYALLKDAEAIQRPLTVAILPKLSHSAEIAEEAYKNNLGVMLHMPMQPKSAVQKLEPHTIMVTTSDADIVRYLDDALNSIPHVEGVNNHMGSAATSDKRVMQTVLAHLKTRNVFFVDSHVIAGTVCAPIAKAVGIRFGQRSVFIDNEMKLLSIEDQLRDAMRLALLKKEVIVIGHDKKVTLQAIRSMVPEIEKAGIRLVYARDLVK